jgi:hypothetical protein
MPSILLRRNDNFERKSSIFGATIYLKSRHGAKPDSVRFIKSNYTAIKQALQNNKIPILITMGSYDQVIR